MREIEPKRPQEGGGYQNIIASYAATPNAIPERVGLCSGAIERGGLDGRRDELQPKSLIYPDF